MQGRIAYAQIVWQRRGAAANKNKTVLTDGIAGIFEGHFAEKLRLLLVPEERTMLKSAVGKMVGCLFGAGVVLIIAGFVNF